MSFFFNALWIQLSVVRVSGCIGWAAGVSEVSRVRRNCYLQWVGGWCLWAIFFWWFLHIYLKRKSFEYVWLFPVWNLCNDECGRAPDIGIPRFMITRRLFYHWTESCPWSCRCCYELIWVVKNLGWLLTRESKKIQVWCGSVPDLKVTDLKAFSDDRRNVVAFLLEEVFLKCGKERVYDDAGLHWRPRWQMDSLE